MGLSSRQVIVVGDDLESDVLGAQAAGLKGGLVRTGKFRAGELDQCKEKPDAVWDSIAELPNLVINQLITRQPPPAQSTKRAAPRAFPSLARPSDLLKFLWTANSQDRY